MQPLFAIEQIARVCHETNGSFCDSIGDHSQTSWDDAEPWQRESAIKGVEYFLANPLANPIDQHQAWSDDKLASGWVYGPVKDADKKTHPCLVHYDELPIEQRTKDKLFQGVVKAMCAKVY